MSFIFKFITIGTILVGGLYFIFTSQSGVSRSTDEKQSLVESPKNTEINVQQKKEDKIISSDAAKTNDLVTLIKLDVPFISQAPFGEWEDSYQQDGCEEASVIMGVNWARGVKSISKEKAKEDILAVSNFEEKTYGSYHDTSVDDTYTRIIKGYFNFDGARVRKNVRPEDLIDELMRGNAIIVPANGQMLKNPFYTAPGPEKHMLILIGYDPKTKEFITQDPGTRQGKDFRYKEDVLFRAIADYPTGDHLPRTLSEKNVIVIEKNL